MPGIHTCYKCVEREIGCHGTCEKYQAAKEKNDKILAERQKDDDFYNFKRKQHERSIRGTLSPVKSYLVHGKRV